MKTGLIAFDYDGVLADTFEPNIRLINRIFRQMGNSAEITKEHFNIATEISFEAVVTAAGLAKEDLAEFMHLIVETGSSIIEETSLFDGMKGLLNSLSDHNYLAVVSNNSIQIVTPGLEKEGALSLFDEITGSDNGESKEFRLEKLKEQYNIPLENCWMIGDGINDIESAHEAKWKSIAVTWGFQNRSLLESRNPTAVVDTLSELSHILTANEDTL
jgi:phosphoglycolate phosphatase